VDVSGTKGGDVWSCLRSASGPLALVWVVACSGAANGPLLEPPASATESAEASTSTHYDASGSTVDASTSDAASQGQGDEASQDDDAAPDDAPGGDDGEPGAEPASPCPVCTLGTTCCTKAGSTQYGMCYSAVLCFGLCC